MFTLDRGLGWYNGKINWTDKPAIFHLDVAEEESPEEVLKQARLLWSDKQTWQKLIEDKIIEDLLELKNDNWLDEDEEGNEEEPLTAEDFLPSIQLG
jgi:hypothetical protein